LVKVTGPEFPGIDASEKRPVLLIPPEFSWARGMGGVVEQTIAWSLEGTHKLMRKSENSLTHN